MLLARGREASSQLSSGPKITGQVRIIDRHFRTGEISSSCADRLAELKHLVPAHIARAARVARSVKTRDVADRDIEIERIVVSSLKAAGHPHEFRSGSLPGHYDPAFLNTTCDLAGVAERLRTTRSARLLMYGPPGTGKSGFAHYLARVLDMPILLKLGSDLLSMWVGGTEKHIAQAFSEARDENAILVIDEADGFLGDRAGARRSWEIRQVNELLTQMEAFNGIFVASTNLVDTLDPASMRRFDFKVKFDWLNTHQRRILFRKVVRYAEDDNPEWRAILQRLDRLNCLTPGDFANVTRQLAVTGQRSSASHIIELLAAEAAMKPGASRASIGFVHD